MGDKCLVLGKESSRENVFKVSWRSWLRGWLWYIEWVDWLNEWVSVCLLTVCWLIEMHWVENQPSLQPFAFSTSQKCSHDSIPSPKTNTFPPVYSKKSRNQHKPGQQPAIWNNYQIHHIFITEFRFGALDCLVFRFRVIVSCQQKIKGHVIGFVDGAA